MRGIDFAPLYRSTVGFDRLFSLLDNAGTGESASSYPPYNIERTAENNYRISMAVAGFSQEEISIEAHEYILTVKGQKAEAQSEQRKYLFRGIAERGFERRFQLADHVEVSGASLENGLLHIDLVREVPEAMKPRKIAIGEIQSEAGKARQIRAA